MDDELIEAVRTVYVADGFTPQDVKSTYARVNRMEEGGWRVVHVNSDGRTVKEIVTQIPGFFTEAQLLDMDEQMKSGSWPNWTKL